MPLTAYVVNSILVEGEGERQGVLRHILRLSAANGVQRSSVGRPSLCEGLRCLRMTAVGGVRVAFSSLPRGTAAEPIAGSIAALIDRVKY